MSILMYFQRLQCYWTFRFAICICLNTYLQTSMATCGFHFRVYPYLARSARNCSQHRIRFNSKPAMSSTTKGGMVSGEMIFWGINPRRWHSRPAHMHFRLQPDLSACIRSHLLTYYTHAYARDCSQNRIRFHSKPAMSSTQLGR